VRHIGRERHFAEELLLVGAGHLVHAAFVLDISLGGFHQVRGDLAALGDDLVQRLDDGGAAHGDRARTVGAHAKQDLRSVAMDDVDVFDRHAEAVRHHLRERGLMPLAVRV